MPAIEPPTDRTTAVVSVCRVRGVDHSVEDDALAVEEPLEIRVGQRTVSITMRTPGHDRELALGFLFTEGIIADRDQVAFVRSCGKGNVAMVQLKQGADVDLSRLDRNFYTSSSCGVCGKTSMEAVRSICPARLAEGWPVVDAEVIHQLPDTLRSAQPVFDRTGGLHASALFDVEGRLIVLREDVGRHNALDKVIGSRFVEGELPLSDRVLLVSGRASFELVQKAAMAGIPIVAAVGAPSSLAVSLAEEAGITLVGFVKRDRFNIYSGASRLRTCRVGSSVARPTMATG